MTEPAKTITFIAAAALALFAAIATRPSTGDYDVNDQVNKPLVKPFEPSDAKRLSIAEFDEETFTPKTFEVAEKDGLWTLPSKGGYPADADKQLGKAVTEVADREVLFVASEAAEDHAEYGVIDPTSAKLEPGQTGVGERVTLSKADGESLVDIIIGKQVKDQDDQHYVRRHNQDAVFIVNIEPENFSTDFSDWIESDLLKISPWDISVVRIRDYTAELLMTLQGMLVDTTYRTNMTFRYDDSESKWNLEKLEQATNAKKGEFEAVTLADDQELDNQKLQDLKNALDDLKIVDVASKPEGLSAGLKAGEEFVQDQQAMVSLIRKGFAPVRTQAGELEILSSEGEVIVTMKDGVEYVLRFGNLKMDASGNSGVGEQADAATGAGQPDAEQGGDDAAKDGVDRYLFVMARLNEDAIEKPGLEIVPDLPQENAEGDSTEADPPEDDGPEDADGGPEKPADEEPAEGEAVDVDDEGAIEGEDENDKASEDEATELEKAVATRKEVEQRNARLLDEYQDKLAAGRKRVQELNGRFGDWYYVISNDVYKKIHLGRGDVVKAKEKEEEDADASESDDSGDSQSQVGADSAFGPPGSAVPGLPGLDAALEDGADEPAAEEAPSETTASDEAADADEAAPDEATEAVTDEDE